MKKEQALALANLGWPVFPLEPNGKRPLTQHGFKDATTSVYKIGQWWDRHPDANIGVATGQVSGIVVVDVDVKNGAKGRESLALLKGLLPTLTVTTPSGGWHLYYLYPKEGLRSKNGLLPGIDIKADGGYVVGPGSVIDGKPYGWQDVEEHISSITDDVLPVMRNGDGSHRKGPTLPVAEIIAEGSRNSALASLAGTMRRKGMSREEIEAALKAVNERRCSPSLSDKEVEAIAASIARYPDEHRDPSEKSEMQPEETPPDVNETAAEENDPRPPGFTDDALALEFTATHAADWRYVAGWGHWLHWEGCRWLRETTLKAFDQARQICRKAAASCLNAKISAKVASANTVAAVERLARADRRHAATTDQWDMNPWLLNTPGGVVDLRTGELRPHDRSDHMTKIAAATPRGEALVWRGFLRDVTNGNEEMQAYLARMAGYALTGATSEHALFFLYGSGGNGKSVFVNALATIMGDYATNAPMDTFMETRTDRHPTDLAGLLGARLVTAIEVEKGRRWAEAKIKSLTGGDKISARFMRQDFFEYRPQFKLLIAGNHKPSIRDVDEAMRRRLHLVPFIVTIPKNRRDKLLSEKLMQERDGILRWALDGCLEWQRLGLMPPNSVVEATEEYFEAEDTLGRWISEECAESSSVTTGTEQLYGSWKAWSEKWGEQPGSMKRFAEELANRGFQRWRSGKQRGFRGISLKGKETQGEML